MDWIALQEKNRRRIEVVVVVKDADSGALAVRQKFCGEVAEAELMRPERRASLKRPWRADRLRKSRRRISERFTVNDETHDGVDKEKEKGKKTTEGGKRKNETKMVESRQDERRGFLGREEACPACDRRMGRGTSSWERLAVEGNFGLALGAHSYSCSVSHQSVIPR